MNMITTKLYLDTRLVNAQGESVLKVRLTENRKTAYISTSIKINPQLWDGRKVLNSPHLNNIINMYYDRVRGEIVKLELSGQLAGLTIIQVRDKVLRMIKGSDEDIERHLFLDAYKTFANNRTSRATRCRYVQLIQHLLNFDADLEHKTFENINANWIKSLQSYLSQYCGLKTNTINLYLNQIKAVFNNAIDEEITTNNPFRKIKLKNQPTMKRALNVDQLRQLMSANFKSKTQERARDYFMLAFYLVGINMVDLARITSLNGDRIEYIRAKTKKPISIKVEPEAMVLIEKYKGSKYLVDILDKHKTYTSHSTTIDGYLSSSQFIDNSFPAISLYWARHTWATIAAELDVPKEVIGHALSHSQNSVTDVYIAFNRKKIDDANRKVIDYVHKKCPEE